MIKFNLKFITKVILCMSLLFVLSCTTQPTEPVRVPVGTPLLIDSKARVKAGGDEHSIQIQMALLPQKFIRMEVTALLGYKVASILMSPQRLQYALHTNHTYYDGPMSARSLFPIFKKSIDPLILWKVIHGQNPQNVDLRCQLDEKQRPQRCVGQPDLQVLWTYEDNPVQKRIDIKSNQFEMAWIFKNQTVLEVDQNETFVLKKPEGYKEFVLK